LLYRRQLSGAISGGKLLRYARIGGSPNVPTMLRRERFAGCRGRVRTIVYTQSSAIAYTGNEWRDVSESQRKAYVFEVLDSWATVGRILREAKERDPTADFGAVERAVRSIDCAMGRMPYNQVYAIVDRHMNQHPEMWHELMATIVWNALYGACAR
jgi:hypothetical protein